MRDKKICPSISPFVITGIFFLSPGVMPNGHPLDGFFYSILTFMVDSYIRHSEDHCLASQDFFTDFSKIRHNPLLHRLFSDHDINSIFRQH